VRRDLSDDSYVELVTEWLAPVDAAQLFDVFRSSLPWEAREILLFGRRILQPRLIAWAGTLPYRYSGQTLEPRPFAPELRTVVDRAAEYAGVPFNHVLANRYRSGDDSMGMHSDDEPELGEQPQVASVSLGAPRRFVLAPRGKGERMSLVLSSGSLLVMGGACQRRYRHGIPKDPGAEGERISLTLRHVLRPPS